MPRHVQNLTMEYRSRIKRAALASLLIHLVALWAAGLRLAPPIRALGLQRDPIVLNLQPRPAARLIDSRAPAERPVGKTDLISDRDSQARDLSDAEGDPTKPAVEKIAEFDELSAPLPDLPLEPQQPAPPEIRSAPAEASPAPPHTNETTVLALEPPPAPGIEAQAPADEVLLARADPVVLPDPAFDGPQARESGGAASKGFVSFEAMQHEFAPYIQEVRKRVERYWRSAIQRRYSGTSPTKAVIECAINPQGHVLYVEITDGGDSITYAPLCKEAIEKAGPFPPFPFTVPEMYRNKNLEIRWTFSFLEGK